MSWSAFWNGQTTIYVNDRHRHVHYEQIAHDIVGLLPSGRPAVLDYGCGEALSANIVAARCSRLVLSDAAETVRAALSDRFGGHDRVEIASPDTLDTMPAGSFDVVVANSVLQYVKREELPALFAGFRRLLKADGQLILGDLIPADVGPLTDATALLQFARDNGFLIPACTGLVKTFFSDYRKKRAELGLLRFDGPEDVIAILRDSGFHARRHGENIGHNPARMTIVASIAPAMLDSGRAPVRMRERPRSDREPAPVRSAARS